MGSGGLPQENHHILVPFRYFYYVTEAAPIKATVLLM